MTTAEKLPSLYALTAEVQLLLDADEFDDARLEALLPQVEEKTANVVRWIQYQEDLAGAVKARESQVVAARKALEAKAARAREYLIRCLEGAGITTVTDTRTGTTIRLAQNPPKVEVDDAAAIPGAYFRWPPAPGPEPDKKKILEAFKAGEPVPGCHLSQSTRLEVT